MKSLLRLFLLLGVILGLAGQSVAFASSPCAVMQQERVSAMAGMSNCAMGQHRVDNYAVPCKNMTPGCLTMAGCAALAAIGSLPVNVEVPIIVARLDVWPATPVLSGRSVAPDPDPPSILV